ncbi:hypothetical protein [Breoghania sp.]|uniref:hypothetical protein n=1 Tax=Breoghania sp. TaxID=2065378 RepID=UPI002AAA8E9B|nr:hypothetical protein [Breoghania sp.]
MESAGVSASPRITGDSSKKREQILAQAIQDVAAELRLIDVTDLIFHVLAGKHANIDDLVRSSTELYFKPNTMCYGSAANLELTWGSTPTIILDLQFRHHGVWIHFGLSLSALQAGVDMYHIEFSEPSENPQANTELLISALKDARLPGPRARSRIFQ